MLWAAGTTLIGEPLASPLHTLFPLYIWALVPLWAPWVVAIGDFVLGNSTPSAAMIRAAIFGSAKIAIAARLSEQPWPGRASSGIAVLSPALFTLVTVQHLELTPGMSYRQCGSQGKWPARLSEETNTLFTLPFISINSVCGVQHAWEVEVFA